MIDAVYFEFGLVEIYKYFVIVVMKEGITVKPEYNADLESLAEKYFKDKKFGYITNRKNSYAVNPMIYLKTSEIQNLVAFAVVSPDGMKATNLEVEKLFLKKPLKHFTNIEDAKIWIVEMIENPYSR
ncbi:hypothetical protein Aeqsu_2842 [Aequorivita sublithincola DSM 14238]|uniref:STAS/SEC14 domain-containing protein n=1 Tax=Aequorivita sublithincola (strain DSM 14238 / LMG 21431 / ACAM 643 / 9-3) TaxID=746697 RepID=I3YZ71_AEQSU|nr:hypothetical protein [Aequorivita sublithincola]AFL82289.1 hypothetical protein Aeqsu_2842 [Aequorivita sublithincola DSM 14238]